jgi:hypothetical protein
MEATMATRQPLAIDAPEHFALIPRIGRYFDLIEVGEAICSASRGASWLTFAGSTAATSPRSSGAERNSR